jgi:hypothetical protein
VALIPRDPQYGGFVKFSISTKVPLETATGRPPRARKSRIKGALDDVLVAERRRQAASFLDRLQVHHTQVRDALLYHEVGGPAEPLVGGDYLRRKGKIIPRRYDPTACKRRL